MDQARIYSIPTTTTRCHAPPSPPPTSAAVAMPPYTTSTTPRTISATYITSLPQSSPPSSLPSQSNHQGHKGRDCFCGKNHHEGGLVRWAAATMGWVGVGLGTSRGACLFGDSRHHKGAIGLAVDSRGGCQPGVVGWLPPQPGVFGWLPPQPGVVGWLPPQPGVGWLAATTAGGLEVGCQTTEKGAFGFVIAFRVCLIV
ncbi:hypothetical protein Tco_0458748 [Tanacetum coccineum]